MEVSTKATSTSVSIVNVFIFNTKLDYISAKPTSSALRLAISTISGSISDAVKTLECLYRGKLVDRLHLAYHHKYWEHNIHSSETNLD